LSTPWTSSPREAKRATTSDSIRPEEQETRSFTHIIYG
jgi:hypothetical protein